jgi:hypothetical protein
MVCYIFFLGLLLFVTIFLNIFEGSNFQGKKKKKTCREVSQKRQPSWRVDRRDLQETLSLEYE